MIEYIELHVASAFSFLEGASVPEQLVERAARLGYPVLALLDRDGVYGAPRFYQACRQAGIRPALGAEITTQRSRLPLLVENRTGYQNLCRLITRMKLRSKKGEGSVTLDEIAESSSGLVCLTGGAEGRLHHVLENETEEAACDYLLRLRKIFGPNRLYLELQRHFDRRQERINQGLVELSRRFHLPLIATNGVRYAAPATRPLLDVFTCIRQKTTLDLAGTLLSRNSERYLKTPARMAKLFADLPQAVAGTRDLADRLQFTLQDLGYRFPEYPVPPGDNMNSYLRRQTEEGARRRYRPYHSRARRQIARELELIEKLDLAGYFLIVWDIVRFCREQDILVQGRGSAANSAVCYSLGITAVDPVGMDLLFERFLSEERGEWPDIDLDLPSGDRRERVIQYIYERYGERGAAMTANVITYREKSAVREVGKALGFPPETLDRLSRLMNAWRSSDLEQLHEHFQQAGLEFSHPQVVRFIQLWTQIQDLPRHLGQHSGGMVIAEGRLDTVVPLENATMPGRRVVQWDKEDCADLGIIKVDLLGLGMMAVLQDSIQLIHQQGGPLDLAHLPPDDPEVYATLRKADTIGLFQVESRVQMATLPRLKPRCFYDLVVEVAIIRPGPIVGQMVHPYLKRRAGLEPVTYPHPCLEPILKRTLGVPIFQEQLLRMAMTAAGFTGGQAEELRRALGFKRSAVRMQAVELKLREGLKRNGITGQSAETIIRYITSFALYGFPESHAASFALLAYASAYIKVHYPAVFYTALLNNQPMGFYHPSTLVKDAQRHHQHIKPVDVFQSDWFCTIEEDGSVRLGLMYVSGLREEAGQKLVRSRQEESFRSLEDLHRRAGLRKLEMETLAEIGALNRFGFHRRSALWQIEKTCRPAGPLLAKEKIGDVPPVSRFCDRKNGKRVGRPRFSRPDPPFRPRKMSAQERLVADYRGTGLSLGPHPMGLQRPQLSRLGVIPAARLSDLPDGRRVRVAGGIIARQRPGTARGFLFLSLEDESGISNIVVRPELFERNRLLLLSQPFLLVEGVLQNQNNVASIRAQKFEALDGFPIDFRSHNFH